MTSAELPTLDIAQLRDLLGKGIVSSSELIESLRHRIEQIEPKIGAYLSLDFDAALAEAENARTELPLGGIPIAIKDLINVAGQPCTCASNILAGYRAPYDATVISKLRATGAIPLGRTNMDEFAMGSSTENSNVRPTRNPWDVTRVPGGSSGGSAAAVAADIAIAALGTDTGGSIRQPAAMCGVVGLKPTYGRVSRYGVTAFASSLDQVGPLTKTVQDAAMVLGAIAGHDPRDSTSSPAAVTDYVAPLGCGVRGVRIGRPREYFVDGVDPQVRAAVDAAAEHFSSLGAEIVDVSLPHTEYAIAAYYIIATAEASANLARFDGVRYGFRAPNPRDLAEQYTRTRGEGFGPEVKRRILLGTHVLSSGYYDAYYLRAQKVRKLIRRDFVAAFEKVDVLISPTTPEVAFKLGERTTDPLRMYLADIFTNAANLAGICAISLPCGFALIDSAKVPIGLQLLGKPFDEERILQLAHAYEQSTDWHKTKATI
jgi:aspartyl-tRNA(Asn)/glutamyl-tRNA(Gln) amidotransferase subunit A